MVRSGESLATITTHWLSEQGNFHLNEEEWNICKKSFLSGQWTLEKQSTILGNADKKNVFSRTFEVAFENTHWLLKAKSAFGRGFEILQQGRQVGTIEPVHAFTRRSTIDCSDEVPIPLQLFCFWLAMITWRRAQNSNGGS